MEEIEEWRVIKDFPNYMVSSFGRIKSLGLGGTNQFKGKERILKQRIRRCYLSVRLYNNAGKAKDFTVHRLVAEAFIPNPHNLPCINHKSEVKTENTVENLEWTSYKLNCNYGSRNIKISNSQINSKNKSKPVLQYTLEGEFIREWPSTHEIERSLGFFNTNIGRCCNNKQGYKTAYGYIWRYKEKDAA